MKHEHKFITIIEWIYIGIDYGSSKRGIVPMDRADTKIAVKAMCECGKIKEL